MKKQNLKASTEQHNVCSVYLVLFEFPKCNTQQHTYVRTEDFELDISSVPQSLTHFNWCSLSLNSSFEFRFFFPDLLQGGSPCGSWRQKRWNPVDYHDKNAVKSKRKIDEDRIPKDAWETVGRFVRAATSVKRFLKYFNTGWLYSRCKTFKYCG